MSKRQELINQIKELMDILPKTYGYYVQDIDDQKLWRSVVVKKVMY
jgi:predicted HAD superfamily Cof-like phosphohydrolase